MRTADDGMRSGRRRRRNGLEGATSDAQQEEVSNAVKETAATAVATSQNPTALPARRRSPRSGLGGAAAVGSQWRFDEVRRESGRR